MSKVDQETALADFQRMCETADCSTEIEQPDWGPYADMTLGQLVEELGSANKVKELLDEKSATDLQGNIDFLVEKIMAGEFSVDENGLAVMHLKTGKTLRFRVPEGREIAMVAGAPEGKEMVALVNLAAALTGLDAYKIGKLAKREWKLAVRLAGFLSAD